MTEDNPWIERALAAAWRGAWCPQAGASFGLGPLKTCYGTHAARDVLP